MPPARGRVARGRMNPCRRDCPGLGPGPDARAVGWAPVRSDPSRPPGRHHWSRAPHSPPGRMPRPATSRPLPRGRSPRRAQQDHVQRERLRRHAPSSARSRPAAPRRPVAPSRHRAIPGHWPEQNCSSAPEDSARLHSPRHLMGWPISAEFDDLHRGIRSGPIADHPTRTVRPGDDTVT